MKCESKNENQDEEERKTWQSENIFEKQKPKKFLQIFYKLLFLSEL